MNAPNNVEIMPLQVSKINPTIIFNAGLLYLESFC